MKASGKGGRVDRREACDKFHFFRKKEKTDSRRLRPALQRSPYSKTLEADLCVSWDGLQALHRDQRPGTHPEHPPLLLPAFYYALRSESPPRRTHPTGHPSQTLARASARWALPVSTLTRAASTSVVEPSTGDRWPCAWHPQSIYV